MCVCAGRKSNFTLWPRGQPCGMQHPHFSRSFPFRSLQPPHLDCRIRDLSTFSGGGTHKIKTLYATPNGIKNINIPRAVQHSLLATCNLRCAMCNMQPDECLIKGHVARGSLGGCSTAGATHHIYGTLVFSFFCHFFPFFSHFFIHLPRQNGIIYANLMQKSREVAEMHFSIDNKHKSELKYLRASVYL